MKKCYLNWNKDTVEDSAIFNHLYELSDGKINLKGSNEDLTDSSNLLRGKKKKHTTNNSGGKKNYRSNNRGKKRY
jgi:hypothetical protein